MRKIEQQLKAAWEAGRARTINNSRVEVEGPRVSLLLFSNEIARRYDDLPGVVFWTYAGWSTVTTKSRLRNVCGLRLSPTPARSWNIYLTRSDGNAFTVAEGIPNNRAWQALRENAALITNATLAEPTPAPAIGAMGEPLLVDIGVY